MDLKIIDNGAKTWFVNLGAFRLPHPLREGVYFDPGTKYLVESDPWMDSQPTLVPTEVDEDLSELQLHPKHPGSPQFDRAADDEAAAAAVAKHVAAKKPHLAKAKAREDAAALAASQAELASRQKQIDAETARQTGADTKAD